MINAVSITGYTVKANGGWKSGIRIVDASSIPFTGRPFVRRRIFSTVWCVKGDAQQRAEKEAKEAIESGTIP